jgi:hypothetical protein
VHRQLNSILPVHLEAPPRDEILAMFGAVDTDGNGFLARDEFRHFCTMLFSDDTKPHAISLVRVSREVITNLLMLPAACQIVSHYTAVVPLINRVPTVFLAPAITVRRHAIIIQLYKHLRAVHDSKVCPHRHLRANFFDSKCCYCNLQCRLEYLLQEMRRRRSSICTSEHLRSPVWSSFWLRICLEPHLMVPVLCFHCVGLRVRS